MLNTVMTVILHEHRGRSSKNIWTELENAALDKAHKCY